MQGSGRVDLAVDRDRIVALAAVPSGAERVDVSGKFLVPAFIDSHVHLAYLPRAAEHARGGIAAAVDLASPEAFLADRDARLVLLRSGPMLTAPRGYPLESWGSNGYGVEID